MIRRDWGEIEQSQSPITRPAEDDPVRIDGKGPASGLRVRQAHSIDLDELGGWFVSVSEGMCHRLLFSS
jgi:hypothetical protein